MRLVRQGFGAVLVSAALMITAQPVLASPASAADPAGVTWKPCVEDKTAECGTLRLPVDWRKPRGAAFDLAVARRVATDPAKRIGVLVINPGGPGGSGVDFALGAGDYFSPEIRARFDIVGFDPRGVARSHPVVCSADVMSKAPSPLLASQADFDRLVKYNATLAKDCRARTGPLFDHVDTLGVVRDIDALRKALGEQKINYYGISYGTLIGQQYAEQFPKNFRALVVDSNMDHSLDTRRFLQTETVTGEANFTEFARWCTRDAKCALHKEGVSRVWKQLQAKADRGELTDPSDPKRKVTAWEISGTAFGTFYGPDWKYLADWLASLHSGKPMPGGGAAPTVRKSSVGPDLVENPIAVFCEDWRMQIRDYRQAAQYWAEAKRLAPHMRMSPIGWGVGSSCLGFGAPVNNPQHRLSVRGAAPILMTNALYDPATGHNWAVNASRQLGRASTLVTYEGWGHGVYGRGPCTTSVTDRYLVDLTVPKRGTRCPAVPPVFEPSAKRAGAPTIPATPLPWG